MGSWHRTSCIQPDVCVVGDDTLFCSSCDIQYSVESSGQISRRTVTAQESPSIPALPPTPKNLDLRWPSSVPYFRPSKSDMIPGEDCTEYPQELFSRLALEAQAPGSGEAQYLNKASKTGGEPGGGSGESVSQEKGTADKKSESELPYQQMHLDGTDEIRILQLHEGMPDSPVHIRVEVMSLSKKPNFQALSYTWADREGDSSKSHVIFLGPGWLPFPVTKNCWNALRDLRLRDRARTLWVDSICINQDDQTERSHQVGLMRCIYAACESVVVYLGTSDSPEDAKAMQVLQLAPPYASPHWETPSHPGMNLKAALLRILEFPYFRRRWVIQEFLLAKHVYVRLGQREASWTTLVKPNVLAKLRASSAADWVTLEGYVRKGIPTRDLGKILITALQCQCQDPRDAIFALCGLFQNTLEDGLLPDYRLSVFEVYVGAASYILTQLKQDWVLLLASYQRQKGHHLPSLPSWVPNWRGIGQDTMDSAIWRTIRLSAFDGTSGIPLEWDLMGRIRGDKVKRGVAFPEWLGIIGGDIPSPSIDSRNGSLLITGFVTRMVPLQKAQVVDPSTDPQDDDICFFRPWSIGLGDPYTVVHLRRQNQFYQVLGYKFIRKDLLDLFPDPKSRRLDSIWNHNALLMPDDFQRLPHPEVNALYTAARLTQAYRVVPARSSPPEEPSLDEIILAATTIRLPPKVLCPATRKSAMTPLKQMRRFSFPESGEWIEEFMDATSTFDISLLAQIRIREMAALGPLLREHQVNVHLGKMQAANTKLTAVFDHVLPSTIWKGTRRYFPDEEQFALVVYVFYRRMFRDRGRQINLEFDCFRDGGVSYCCGPSGPLLASPSTLSPALDFLGPVFKELCSEGKSATSRFIFSLYTIRGGKVPSFQRSEKAVRDIIYGMGSWWGSLKDNFFEASPEPDTEADPTPMETKHDSRREGFAWNRDVWAFVQHLKDVNLDGALFPLLALWPDWREFMDFLLAKFPRIWVVAVLYFLPYIDQTAQLLWDWLIWDPEKDISEQDVVQGVWRTALRTILPFIMEKCETLPKIEWKTIAIV